PGARRTTRPTPSFASAAEPASRSPAVPVAQNYPGPPASASSAARPWLRAARRRFARPPRRLTPPGTWPRKSSPPRRPCTLDESLKPLLPAFFGLLDVPVDDPQWQALDPAQRRHQTLDANKRLLLREAQAQPVIVIFEYIHWVDTETQALLDSLVASLPAARLLMLVNYRPEYQHTWGSKTYYTQLRLDALPAES